MKYTYYFEVAKEAEIAETETGEPSEAYLTASFNSDETHYTEQQILKYIARISQVPIEHLRLIDKEEYDRNMEDESE